MKVSRPIAAALSAATLALSACIAVPVGPEGQLFVYPPGVPPGAIPLGGSQYGSNPDPQFPALLHARLYPANETATQTGVMIHGPVAALSWERVRVDDYTETASPTALTFGGQERKSLRHRLGWQVIGDVPSGWGKLRPYARITHEKEYEDNQGVFSVGVAGSPFTFSTPTRGTKDSWGLLAAGVSIDRKDVNVHIGFTSTFSKSGTREQALMLTVGVPFN